jgi:hypothetical protein
MRLVSSALLAVLPVVASAGVALAQSSVSPGVLVQQDFSDCQNSDVRQTTPPTTMGGAILVSRGSDGNTTVKVALTAARNTTYHFFLKCVRQLGDIQTSEEGVAEVSFSFPTSEAGNVFAFDSYPDGAPAGNKFQSTQIKY